MSIKHIYRLGQIINHSEEIVLPKCMYKMKSIYGNTITTEGVKDGTTIKSLDISEQRPLAEMENIEEFQLALLKQLKELKEQMTTMKQKLTSSAVEISVKAIKDTLPKKSTVVDVKVADLGDIVINASPKNVPYFLLAIKQLWKNTVAIEVDCYTHSSVKELTEETVAFVSKISNKLSNTSQNNLHITLIWKEACSEAEIIVSSNMPIKGEVNILRYLTRMVPSVVLYEESDNVNEIDSALDSCYRLSHYRTVKDRQTIIRNFNAKLGKSNWICGTDEISIADIALSCVLKQINTGNDITANMNKWLQRCSPNIGY